MESPQQIEEESQEDTMGSRESDSLWDEDLSFGFSQTSAVWKRSF